MTLADKIRKSDDTELADIICDAMPGNDCEKCKFKERGTGRCTLLEWLQNEVTE